MSAAVSEVAKLFGASLPTGGNAGEEVFPGWPGWVVESNSLRSMAWGFPLSLKGKTGQPLKPKPVNNTRADKLDAFMWRYSFAERRCLIPMTAFAEAEGDKGRKTRTWISLADQPVFACAGIWRDSPEWGPVYSMVMTEACLQISGVHDRMPVILPPEAMETWLAGSTEAARVLCRPYAGELLVERTSEPWAGSANRVIMPSA